MSLSQREKAELRKKAKKELTPTGLYLYHPASKNWIPALCDEEGRLVIDPTDLDTRYLKLNGTNRMDAGAKLQFSTNAGDPGALIKGDASNAWLNFLRYDETDWAAIKFKTLQMVGDLWYANLGMHCYIYDGGWVEMFYINPTSGASRMDILRAGNITPYSSTVPFLGSSAYPWRGAYLKTLYLHYGIPPRIYFSTDDILEYDQTNNRWLFKIGGTTYGYVDTAGFHNGAPP